jgi:formylglycine-generating enzyme required for sulfatase activity
MPDTVAANPRHMAWIPDGGYLMGSDEFYPEESPVHRVEVDGFWIDERPVTVTQFRRFVAATGHRTVAEDPPDPDDYPDADPELLVPGSLVFRQASGPVDLDDFTQWWQWTPGACWHRPSGWGSDIAGLERHPVVHVTHADAQAYAGWAGKSLPTEAEWERAARGGLEGARFAWGDEAEPGGRAMANTWLGEFPWRDLRGNRAVRTTPVGRYPPNGFGLYDMTGNVWEWTDDWFGAHSGGEDGCCLPSNPRPELTGASYAAGERVPRKVIKGGSHLCAPNYCLRFRPAARQRQTVDTSTSHLGFRCVRRGDPAAPPAPSRGSGE